ncbi:WD40 repeat-like protein, partial [Piedraia hortae CBS 480.64]
PPRSMPSHSHSRSSPAGMDAAQRYVPYGQKTPTQASNPKAYNISHLQTPTGAPSHSPLSLTAIRSRAVSDAHDGVSTLLAYSDAPANSAYLAPFPTYAYDWCKWPVNSSGSAGKMAVASYLEDSHNFIQIIDSHAAAQDDGLEYSKVAEATCAYPVTRILWEPPGSQKQSTDLVATSGDHLRLWSLPPGPPPQYGNNITSRAAALREPAPQKLQPLALLSNSKTPEHTAPLTSLDWNTLSPKLIITSSIDTTCTIWDIPTLTAKTQLIAHDREVFDVRFCAGSVDTFVSCGADGSVRMFDLRSLEHSTIIYEPAEKDKEASPSSPMKPQGPPSAPPLLRLAASPFDSHLLATFAADGNIVRILDVRQPGTALLELRGHSCSLNSIEWSPNRRGVLASGADDCLVLTWDLVNSYNQAALGPAPLSSGLVPESQAKGPCSSWRCDFEIGNISWAPQSTLTARSGEWLGVCAGRGVYGVKL